MNWKRIGTGALAAGVAMVLIDAVVMLVQYFVFKWFGGLSFWSVVFGLLSYFLDGFFCAWLYAVVRPRLGPGPKTALLSGTALFFIKQGLSIFLAGRGAVWMGLLWLKLLAGSCVAGWQYIEKAP